MEEKPTNPHPDEKKFDWTSGLEGLIGQYTKAKQPSLGKITFEIFTDRLELDIELFDKSTFSQDTIAGYIYGLLTGRLNNNIINYLNNEILENRSEYEIFRRINDTIAQIKTKLDREEINNRVVVRPRDILSSKTQETKQNPFKEFFGG